MAIKHDDNSQGRTYPNIFARDTTSLKYWADEGEKARKALEAKLNGENELAKLKTTFYDNNLDLSWHGVRVMIVDMKGEKAVDTSIKINGKYSACVSKSDPNNTKQWLRLEKMNRDDLSSAWVIRDDGKEADRHGSVMWDDRDTKILTFTTGEAVLTYDLAHFYISCDSNGFYRFKNVLTTHCIGISTVADPKEAAGLKGMPIKDGIISDQQLWRLERLPTDAALAERNALTTKLTEHIEHNNLDSTWHDTKVNIFNQKGLALDTGPGSDKNWEPWGISWDRGNPNQWIRLQKLQPNYADSTWTLYSVQKNSYIYDDGDRLTLGISDPKNYISMQWRIGVENNGGLSIMNCKSKRCLELVSIDGGDGTAIRIQPRNDGDGKEKQVWKIERLIDYQLVDAQGTRSIDSSFNNANVKVTITDLKGKLSLDLGGSSALRAYFGVIGATTDPNGSRRIILNKVDGNNDQSPWRIRSENTSRTIMGAAPAPAPKPPNTEIAIVPDRPVTNADGLEFQWFFRSTSLAGAFRIQNAKSKLYLEVVESNEQGLFLKPLDVSAGDRQLFKINKISG